MNARYIFIIVAMTVSSLSLASDFASLDEALPTAVDAESIAPVFDFDTDGCLPSAGISRDGEQNTGLAPTGGLTDDCRSSNFLDTSNTLHRYACIDSDGSTYCGHFYTLYFKKDQILKYSLIASGHRHDWEYAAVWTIDGVVAYGSYSAHGDLYTAEADDLEFEDGHLKIVYHKEGLLTHTFRFAKTNETAENPYGEFVTPTIASWYEMYGDSVDNDEMRELLDDLDYGSGVVPLKDSNFLSNLNEFKPDDFPEFTEDSVEASQQ